MKNIILYIWQLPQHLIALGIILYHKTRKGKILVKYTESIKWYSCKYMANAGISLGNYIFLDSDRYNSINSIKHEHGHQIQSLYLGPLYLIVIGIPSFIGNIIDRIHRIDYYNQPWEKWADKLGNVNRNKKV